MIKILFVCYGNICRSTMAQFVFQDMVNRAGLSDVFLIDSKGTSAEESGNTTHRGTVKKLKEVGVPVLFHRASRIRLADYNDFDFIIGMDAMNIRDSRRILRGDPEGKVHSLLSFAGLSRDIDDPWYTGDFDATYDDVLLGCEGLLDYLMEKI